MKNDYSSLLDINKIISTYHKIMINTKHRKKIFDYNMFYMSNLISILNNLENKTYKHEKYNIFLIKEPKPRIIMSERLSDKIVNHLVSDYYLVPLIEPKLIEMNVATRKNKGSKMAIYYMKKYLVNMKKKYNNFYILKCDINKFFYNIDHDILFNKLKKIIKDKDIYNLLKNIISSTNDKYVNESISKIKNKHNIDIPLYKKDKGLPIGNQTSQILAIYYLNDLDHFIKEKLHIKNYIRYMDDFVLIHEDKEYLKYCLSEINKFLEKEKLILNKKTSIYNIDKGISFIGFKYTFKNNRLVMLIPSKTKYRIIKRIKSSDSDVNNYNGYLINGCCRGFKYSLSYH